MLPPAADPEPSTYPASLRDLLDEGFCLLAHLRGGAWPQDPAAFRERLEGLLERFERRARERDKAMEAVAASKYAFSALADEILLAGASPLREEWERSPLQLKLFGEHLAGEGFFRRLERLRQDPAAHHETLDVFHTCLLLGFQGKYLLEDPEKLHWLTTQVGQELARVRGAGPAFSPHGAPAAPCPAPGRLDMPAWGAGVALLAAALLVFMAFRAILAVQARGVAPAAGQR